MRFAALRFARGMHMIARWMIVGLVLWIAVAAA
jgi:hypothetical protein